MTDTVIGAIIGAASAIIINGAIYILSLNKETKREKIQIISEIISLLYNQLRYSKRFAGHLTWFYYYERCLPLIDKPEFHSIAENKIDFHIRMTEEIEFKLIESDTRLAVLTAKYISLFAKDNNFTKSIREINEYVLLDHIALTDFKDWSDDEINSKDISKKVKDEEQKSINSIESSFAPLINSLIVSLEQKIKHYA